MRLDIDFEIKSIMMQQINIVGSLKGVAGEDPHSHLSTSLDICFRFIRPDLSHEALRLLIFPYVHN